MEKSIHTPEYKLFVELLRETRQKAGLTQIQLAEKIGENQVFVSRLERGETRVDVVQLRTLCMALNTTLVTFARRYEGRLAKLR